MDRRCAAGALLALALAACIASTAAAPTASEHTSLDLYNGKSEGCYYNFQHYGEGDRIMTNEPCLNCTCHNRMLMCYLRVCPFTKAIGQDCTVEKRADQCCPIVTCPDVPVDLLTSTSTTSPAEYGGTGVGKVDNYGCTIDGKYFAEGSKVPPTPNKPCEHCYCIRNMTTCVMQECTLHVDGCTPIYHKNVCCPVRYFCDHPEDEMPLLDDMTTTVRPTPGFLLTTTTEEPTTITQTRRECVENDQLYPDGALIKTEKPCVHCYCMKGDIVCVVQECGTPMENEGKNCTSLPPREDQCCPDTYICEGDELTTEPNELTIEDITTMQPPRRVSIEGSGYRNEPDELPFTEIPTLISDVEGSGEEQEPEKLMPHDKVTPEQDIASEPVDDRISTEGIQLTTQSATRVPLLEETETATTEPDKGLNTVPSGIADEDSSEPSLISKTTLGDEPRATEPSVSEQDLTTSGTIEEKTPEPSTVEITTLREDTKVTEPTYLHEQGMTSEIMESDHTEHSILATIPEDLSKTTETQVSVGEQVTSRISDEDTFEPSVSAATTLGSSDDKKTTEPAVMTEQTTRFYERVTESIIVDKTTQKDYSEVTDLPITVEKETIMSEIAEHDSLESTRTSPSGVSKTTESTIVSEQELGPSRDIEEETSKPSVIEKTTLGEIEKVTEPTAASEQNTVPSETVKESSSEPSTLDEITSEDYFKASEPTLITEKVTGTSDISEEKSTEPEMIDRTTIKEIDTTEPSIISYDKQSHDEETSTNTSDYKPSSLPDSSVPVEEENVATTEPTFKKEDESNTLIDTPPQQQEDEKLTTTLVDLSKETDITPEFVEPSSVQTVTPSIIEHKSKTTTATVLEQGVDETIEQKETTTESFLELSTFAHITKLDKESATTVASVSDISSSTPASDKLDLPLTTTINPEENEIDEDVSPISSPGRIPGEGDCLLSGITYKNDSAIPSTNKCHSGCRCVSSIVKCDPIICSSPLEYMENCQLTYDTPNSCCPTYICDHSKETIPPQSHSQMSGTESPLPSTSIECNGDQCEVSEDKQPPTVPFETSTIKADEKPEISECDSDGCRTDSQTPKHPTQQHEDCTDDKCTPVEDQTEITPPKEDKVPEISTPTCEGQSCTDTKDQICHKEGGCEAPVDKTCEGDACELKPDITPSKDKPKIPETDLPPCEGESCTTAEEQPCTKEGGCEILVDKACEGEYCEGKEQISPATDVPQICDNASDCKMGEIPEPAVPSCEGENCESKTEVSPSMDELPKICENTNDCKEIKIPGTPISPCEGENCESKTEVSPSKDELSQICENTNDCKEIKIPGTAVSPCEGENCESKTEVSPSKDELPQICENTNDCKEIKIPGTAVSPCEGENCESKTEVSPSKDELPQICENGDDCKETKIPDTTVPPCAGDKCEDKSEIMPTKGVAQFCENEDDCKEIKSPETAVLPCEGDSCTNKDISSRPQISQEDEICSEESGCKKPEVFVTECKDDNCRRTQISDNGDIVPSKCTSSECLQKESISPTQETTDDVTEVTESPNEKQTSFVSEPEPVTEQGELEKDTELPGSVINNEQSEPTELPDLHVTQNEDTITKLPEQMETDKKDKLSESPDSEIPSTDKIQTAAKTEDISTKAPETVTYQSTSDSTVNEEKMPEITTQEPELATEFPDAHVTGIKMHDSSKPFEDTVTEIQIQSTEQPILPNEEVSPEKSTDEQNVLTENPQVNEPHEISTERPEAYVTERERISTSAPQFEEKQENLQTESPESHITSIDQGSGAPEGSVDEQEEKTTLAPMVSEIESGVSELPEITTEILKSTQSPIEKTEDEISTETHLPEPDVSTKEDEPGTETPVSSEVSQEPEKTEDETSTEIHLPEQDVSTKEDKFGTQTPVSTEVSQDPIKTEDETSTETHLPQPDISTMEDKPGTDTPLSSEVSQEPEKTEIETSTETRLPEPDVSTKEDKSGTDPPTSSEVSQEPEIYRTTELTKTQEIATETSLPAVPDLQDDNEMHEVSEIPSKEEEINTESPIDRVTETEKPSTDFSNESSYDQKTTKAPELNTSEQETETSTKTTDMSKTDEATTTPKTFEEEEMDIYTESPDAGATSPEEYDTKTTVRVATEHELPSEVHVTEPQETLPIEPQHETKTELPLSPTASSEQITTVPEIVTSEEKILTESPLSLVTKAQQPDATTSQQASISELDEAKTDTTILPTIYPETQVSEEETETDNVTEPHKMVTGAPEQHDNEQEKITNTPDQSTEEAQRTETPTVTEVDKTHSESLPPLDTDLGVTELQTEYPEKVTEKDSSVTEQLEKQTEAPAPFEPIVSQLPEFSTEKPQKMETEAEPELVQPHGESSTAMPVPIFTESNEIDTIVTEAHAVQEPTVTEEYETGTKMPGRTGEEEEIKSDVQENIPSEEEVTKTHELSSPEETYTEKSEPATEKPKPEENEILSEIPVHTEKTISIETTPASVRESEKNITQSPEPYVDQELITGAPEEFVNKQHETGTESTELHVTSEKEITDAPDAQEIDVTESPVLLVTKQDESTIIPVSLDAQTEQVTTESSIKEQEVETRAPELLSTKPQEFEIKTEEPSVKVTKSPEIPSSQEDMLTVLPVQKQTIQVEPVTPEQEDLGTTPSKVQEDIQTQSPVSLITGPESIDIRQPELAVTEHEVVNKEEDSFPDSTGTVPIEPPKTTESVMEISTISTLDSEQTSEVQHEYSETTPYLVELELHTHKIIEETSTILTSEELTTARIEPQETKHEEPISEGTTEIPVGVEKLTQAPVTETEKTGDEKEAMLPVQGEQSGPAGQQPALTPENAEKITEPSVEAVEETTSESSPVTGDTQNIDQKFNTESEKEISATFKPSLEDNEQITVALSSETEKPLISDEEAPLQSEQEKISSTARPSEYNVPYETTAPEEEFIPAVATKATTVKVEEEITTLPPLFDKFTKPEQKPSETFPPTPAPEIPKPGFDELQPTDEVPPPEDDAQLPPSGGYGQEPDYAEEDQAFGPGTCRYGGKVYVSAQQIPRDDPCDFCFCFRSDIICLQQSCPPPIHGCHEEPIQGFCCPRYECPVSMATSLNVTTTTTTTTTTLPPHFLPHAYKGAAQRRGCQIKGHTYKVGDVVRASSGPCLHCTCGGDGQMKCDPKACTPEPMLRQMIAAAVSAKRRR